MARGKGTANLAASLEVLAGAPLDARDVCPTVADLYVAANWPYKYIGMKTTVQATGDTYRLVNLDVTQESSWVIDGDGSFLRDVHFDQTASLSTSTETVVTFTDNAITANSLIDVAVSEWGLVPVNVAVVAGSCTVTMPIVETAHSVTVRIYVR